MSEDMTTWDNLRLTTHITALERRLAGALDYNNQVLERHKQDINRIGQELIEEADDREWCDIYDQFVDELNRYLHLKLPVRAKEHRLTIEYRLVLTHDFTATPGENANDMAENLKTYLGSISNHINIPDDWDWDVDLYTTSYDLKD